MDAVRVSLPEGAGVVRRVDGATVVTDDVGEGHGTHLCGRRVAGADRRQRIER
jgi:hypothetical protein